jgi:glycosyltransferase involved in cell wall biosynthesis
VNVGGNRPGTLKVAVVHSFYSSSQPSGENQVVLQQVDALRRAAVSVDLVAVRTDTLARSPIYPLQAGLIVATGRGRSPLSDLRALDPDVVHVHNLFPNFGRTWVREWPGPLVATVHNFRPLCAAATFYRDGRVCTKCLDSRSPVSAVRYGCYRASRLRTLPLAISTRFERDPVLDRADRVLVLSDTMRSLYATAGVPEARLQVVSNFLGVDIPEPGVGGGPWAFVGRLAEEKGILELVRDWPPGYELVVVGDGPLRAAAEAAALPGVRFLGDLPRARVFDILRDATGLVFPSRWYEGFPMVYLEALAAGTPVVAWEPSSVAQLVAAEGTGIVGGSALEVSLARARDEVP